MFFEVTQRRTALLGIGGELDNVVDELVGSLLCQMCSSHSDHGHGLEARKSRRCLLTPVRQSVSRPNRRPPSTRQLTALLETVLVAEKAAVDTEPVCQSHTELHTHFLQCGHSRREASLTWQPAQRVMVRSVEGIWGSMGKTQQPTRRLNDLSRDVALPKSKTCLQRQGEGDWQTSRDMNRNGPRRALSPWLWSLGRHVMHACVSSPPQTITRHAHPEL